MNFIHLMVLQLFNCKKLHTYFTTFYYKGVQSYPVSTKLPHLTVSCLHLVHIFNDKASDRAKMKQILAAKDARMEQLESKITRLEQLESKVTQLEGKVTRLEQKKQLQQELLMEKLKKDREISSSIGENSVGKSVFFPRICRELRASDPSLDSGMNWVNPDGQGVGDDPIYVYCNMG